MITWEPCSNNTILTELDIMNSNPDFNLLSEGKEQLSEQDILHEHKATFAKERYLVQYESQAVGILDFMMLNPKDQTPWLGLLAIHQQHQQQGIGVKVYLHYESLMKQRGIPKVRLGCLKDNRKGFKFWSKMGFSTIKEVEYNGKPLYVMEKNLK